MLETLLRHKKAEKEYLVALIVADNRVDTALWETEEHGHAHVLKTATSGYEASPTDEHAWEKVIDATDKAITSVEAALPEGAELKKVVFGLFPEWLEDDHIKDDRLKQLKQLTTALSLQPVGFVELPTAVAHLLTRDEGTQQTVILCGFERSQVTVSLFKIGKLIKSVTVVRTTSPSQDIEKGLSQFADIEVLPSHLLLYSTTDDLEAAKKDLLSYPWQQKANFLHFPKIDTLPSEFPVQAVAAASATELSPQMESQMVEAQAVEEKQEEPTATITGAPQVTDEVTEVAADLGFVSDQDVAHANPTPQPDEVQMAIDDEATLENVAPPAAPKTPAHSFTLPKLPKLPQFSWPKFSLPTSKFQIPKLGVAGALGIAILILGSVGGASAWFLPKATITVLAQPKMFDKIEEIKIDTKSTAVDTQNKIVPGEIVKTEISGTETITTTGKKTVGEKAKGEVTVFNKTLNAKTFKKGTKLTSGKLNFTLDGDATVASASEGVGSLTYGTTKVAVVAADIGTASNLPTNSDFVFADLPTTSYSARNEAALVGGTSREISVVARADQTQAREAAIAKLETQAEGEITQKLTGNKKLLDNSLQTEVVKESFSKELGDEANELSIDVTLAIEAAAYNEDDFYNVVDSAIGSQIADGFAYRKEDSKITVDDITAKDGIWTFKPHILLKLIPKIEIGDFTQKLAGKTLSQATDYLKSQVGVAGVEYDIRTPLPFFKDKLPLNHKNISIEINSL